MKRSFFLHKAVFYTVLVLLFFSCKKEKEVSLTYFDMSFNPSALSERIPAGLKNSADPFARLVYDDIASMLDWNEFSNQLTLPADAEKINAESGRLMYRWHHNTGSLLLTIRLIFSREGSDYFWEEKIQYGTGTANEYLTVKESHDKKSGSLDYNIYWFCGLEQLTESCDAVNKHYTWTLKDDESVLYVLTEIDPFSDSGEQVELRLNLNSDGTGNTVAIAGTQYYTAAWDIQGNGIYTLHNGDDTQIHEWTAGE